MKPLHVVVMGVAGCGKSVAGQGIAVRLGLPLVEGDDFHPPGNIEKMRRGVPDRGIPIGWQVMIGSNLFVHMSISWILSQCSGL